MDKIDNLDRKILGILSKNARIPFKDVAAECGVSRAAIDQRMQHLVALNSFRPVIQRYEGLIAEVLKPAAPVVSIVKPPAS